LSHTVWRIATDTPTYTADDLTGEGAKRTGGRWNAKGTPAVYTSETRALACLETVVHLGQSGLPFNRYLVEVTIPTDIWKAAQRVTVAGLPIGWDAEPPGMVSLNRGTNWLKSASSVVLVVPSIIVPEERNILINPLHPDSSRITAVKVRKWLYDPRLDRKTGITVKVF
jgi:RES domain-containing protein